jgi:hypothetical protein
MPIIKSLSVTQMNVLSTAARRPDHMVLPPPAARHARGAAQRQLLSALLKAALAEELPVSDDALCWKRNANGECLGLRLTKAGLAAVPSPKTRQGQKSRRPSMKAPDAAARRSERIEPGATPQPGETKRAAGIESSPLGQAALPKGKLGQVLSTISSEAGATVAELVSLTGWQSHSARAALTGLRQRGFAVRLIERQGRKAYRLAAH